ncbi:MAG: DNA-processing protein DprA [Ignavibacteria bacterium]
MEGTDTLKYIFFLTKVKNLGNKKIKNILNRIPDLKIFLKTGINDFRKIEGIDYNISGKIYTARENFSAFEKEFENILSDADKKKINILTIFDADYPENLRRIFDAPVILYYKGKLDWKDQYSLSIVGTRNPTEYGKYTCEKFTEQLSELGIPIVSGFARGIDSIVHKTCLKNNNLNYAVFGCGVDVIYPEENGKIYSALIEKGAVISEFPMGTKPDRVNFPMRNRIISGISLGTVVIESGMKGGSLLTAELAIDQDKEVFAVPGYINSRQSEGTNELIKKGHAKLVTCTDDIINEIEIKLRPILKKELIEREVVQIANLSNTEKTLFDAIEYEPLNIDTINEVTGLAISDCLVNLLSLEFKGLIRQIPGKNFTRI